MFLYLYLSLESAAWTTSTALCILCSLSKQAHAHTCAHTLLIFPQGAVLYSTRPAHHHGSYVSYGPAANRGKLMERAASPLLFDSNGNPMNVPNQTQFWTNPGQCCAFVRVCVCVFLCLFVCVMFVSLFVLNGYKFHAAHASMHTHPLAFESMRSRPHTPNQQLSSKLNLISVFPIVRTDKKEALEIHSEGEEDAPQQASPPPGV